MKSVQLRCNLDIVGKTIPQMLQLLISGTRRYEEAIAIGGGQSTDNTTTGHL